MLSKKYLRTVPLPQDLNNTEIFRALQATQDFFHDIRQRTGIVLSNIIQANNFSGLVSNVFTKKLSETSNYNMNNQQRYPDLIHPSNSTGLEVKASNKPLKGGEGHNGHSGWHIIVCYEILEMGDVEFTNVEIANLIGFECANSDWTYNGSKRNANNSQRTETYVTTGIGTAKLRDGSVYLNPNTVTITSRSVKNRKALPLPIPYYSPFYER